MIENRSVSIIFHNQSFCNYNNNYRHMSTHPKTEIVTRIPSQVFDPHIILESFVFIEYIS
jgi:hypothetical protein